eukprot:TRINITY_DN100920_c0_g1_i1.p1 TRINITY_DN100920_c0_g1~~TRINITY_DN100920_c0_g1_i1.p1  ORF type:complete len:1243 (+),score=364.43 TRINITY_DN100920_c0_g1_i1:167-3895(+)
MAPGPKAVIKRSAVKQELGATPAADDGDRAAKIKARMETIRASARGDTNAVKAAPIKPAPSIKGFNPEAFKKKADDDSRKLEKMLPPLEERVSSAEEEMERVAIHAAPLAMEATEEVQELQAAAVRDTERVAKTAASNVALIRREIDRREKEVATFAPVVKQSGKEELKKFTERLDVLQKRLDELKSVRKSHELALAAEKLFAELTQRLVSIEIDCEKASMMTEPIASTLETNPDSIDLNELREAKDMLRLAQATLAPTMRMIAGKVAGLQGATKQKMLDLQSRAEAAQAMLDKAHKTADEAQSQAACGPVVKAAQDHLAKVQQALDDMRESETPFLMGIECVADEEGSKLITAMETSVADAQSAVAEAHKYVALKMVEIGRINSQSAATSGKAQLEAVKKQLEAATAAVQKFQAQASKRKKSSIALGMQAKTEESAEAVKKLKDLGTALQCAGPGDEMKEALQQAHDGQVAAEALVAAMRKNLLEKQADLRPAAGESAKTGENMKISQDLNRMKTKMSAMEGDLKKFRQMLKDFDEKIKVEKTLGPVIGVVNTIDEEVTQLVELSETWDPSAGGVPIPAEDEAKVTAGQKRLTDLQVKLDKKQQEATGAEYKELQSLMKRIHDAQEKVDVVKEKLRRRHKAEASEAVKKASAAVTEGEKHANKVSAAAQGLAKMSLSKLEQVQSEAQEAVNKVAKAQEQVSELANSASLLEAKVELARLQLRCKQAEKKARNTAGTVAGHYERTSQSTVDKVMNAMRDQAYGMGEENAAELIFENMADKGKLVTMAEFNDYLARHCPELSDDEVNFTFGRISTDGNLTRPAFVSEMQQFMAVSKEVTITDGPDVSSSQTVRKLALREVVEITGSTQEHNNLLRSRCRAVKDGCTGWLTHKQKASGPDFLQRVARPLLWCNKSLSLTAEDATISKTLRDLLPGEVLDLLQGPQEERMGEEKRVKGLDVKSKSAEPCWLQIKSRDGKTLARLSTEMHKCAEAIAMTDAADFETCVTLRRVAVGEVLELLPDKEVVPENGGKRQKFKACKDGAEGWVTVIGTQGTHYLNPVPRHYICLEEAPVLSGGEADAPVLRVLSPGNAFAATAAPQDVHAGGKRSLYRVRARKDGLEGQVASTGSEDVIAWTKKVKVLQAVTMTKEPATVENPAPDAVRMLEPDELLHAIATPVEDAVSGEARIKVIADSDKAVGWVAFREGASSTSPVLVRPLLPTEAARRPGAASAGKGAKAWGKGKN